MLPLQIRNINSKILQKKNHFTKGHLFSSGPLIYSSPNIAQPPSEKTKHKAK